MIWPVFSLALLAAMLFACSASPAPGEPPVEQREQSAESPAHSRAAEVQRTGKLAFPGALGHGALAIGGRDGRIISVSTLADRQPGSLRECLTATGPRTCVFDVAGTIRFEGEPPIIREPFLTIAGETAPGAGITLAHSGGPEARSPLLIKNTHDVVVRHIRVRNDRMGDHREAEDAITIEGSEYVIVDHVSASWARDEIVNGYADNDWITISNSIFAFGLKRHDKCALLASDPHDAQHVSFVMNICAHSGDRNPDINFPPGSCVEVTNNVFFNAQSEFAEIWETYGGSPVSLVGNWFIAGPSTTDAAIGIVRQQFGTRGPARLYERDNSFDGAFRPRSPDLAQILVDEPPCPLATEPQPAARAFASVLKHSGAWPRDAIDAEVVANIRQKKGRIVRTPGRIPEVRMSASPAKRDSDRDGMPDSWETRHGSDPQRADSWADADGDGWANFENYLAERASARRSG
ncbi:pectate lyase [Qipengyuania sp. XHP0211]|uniref:pectate lyase family protein n=1 Tax=Qipengyuania sp. XHP0211 TaxID=3038079 RepID=UPI00241F50BC|nr:pectate lyase [Qipengyuania sp. XHP0211]MDG5750416.1 pectate lyase [Qipengyuania sp. XHP0211]